jgi:hypothetical protein
VIKSNRFLLALCGLLLVWSYFARPWYDFVRIASGRVWDAQVEKHSSPFLRQGYDTVLDAATQQVDEINAYLQARRLAAAESPAIQHLDFSSPDDYIRSSEELRAHLRECLRYEPDSFAAPTEAVQETALGEDALATYAQLRVPIAPGLHSIGIYMLPRNRAGRLPLVIAALGRGDPDQGPDGKVALLTHSDRDLAKGALERGYAVWEPMFAYYARNQPANLRERLAVRAQEVGTTLPAIEILKIVRSLDALSRRPEIDPARVAMVGMSYGGFYTLYTTALDPRIKAAVVAAYFNDRAALLDATEPSGYPDWRFPDSLTVLRDPFIAALVCPRPLEVQAGTRDQLFPFAGAQRTVPLAAEFYHKLHVDDRFKFVDFVGRHDFRGSEAWEFLSHSF